MKQFLARFLSMIFGLALYALGIVVSIAANVGYAPWDAFHAGLAARIGITIGTASISVGLVIVVIAALSGERLGLGTLSNMVLIGLFTDLIMGLGLVPKAKNFAVSIGMLIVGMLIISFGSYFYIKAGFGAGPRDSLMVVLARKTGRPVGLCRTLLEMTAALVGWLLGGMVGIGTVISFVTIGACIQLVFSLLKFDVAAVRHETLRETVSRLGGGIAP